MSESNGTKIFHTREYRKFKLIKGNRIVDENHVRALMKSMRNKDLLIPIAVNSKMEVLDGQHRLEARKRLAYDVPYYWTGDDMRRGFQGQGFERSQKTAEMLVEIEPFFSHWTHRNFVRAVVKLLKKKQFNWKVFMKKVEMNPTLMQVCMTTEQYLDLIEKIYNYKAQNKVSLKYGD